MGNPPTPLPPLPHLFSPLLHAFSMPPKLVTFHNLTDAYLPPPPLLSSVSIATGVEGLYCKRPIHCLASSEILNPHPSPPGECVPPSLGAGVRHTRWVERGWGVNSSEDARHCSVLYICKYFVVTGISAYLAYAKKM
jgi:hypothetical protein